MAVCFFEDDRHTHFYPLTLTRPVDDLRLGVLTLREKWLHALQASQWHRCLRPSLRTLFASPHPAPSQPCYWVNSRFLPVDGLAAEIKNLSPGTCLQHQGSTIAACVNAERSQEWIAEGLPNFNALMVMEARNYTRISHLWDLFLLNEQEIARDVQRLQHQASDDHSISGKAVLDHPENMLIGQGVTIEPGAILLAKAGPIYLGKGATIMAGACLRGPVAVGAGATVKTGATIDAGTTIGPVCKVGGEVGHSIFHSYSNKGHDGYVGNSLIGQWCNFGAGSNTSNLKNNYSTVRLTDWKSQKERETGQQFIGTIMGDHSSTAINTRLNTGTVCGVSCNIFSGDFPPKFLPSFSWAGSNVIQPYRAEKAFEKMQAMMARRDMPFTDDYKALMQHIFDKEQA